VRPVTPVGATLGILAVVGVAAATAVLTAAVAWGMLVVLG